MAAKWIEALTGSLEQKKQYKQAKTRQDELPKPYDEAAEAVNRYLLHTSGVTDGDVLVQMFVGIVDLFEQASVDGSPVSEILGDDPVAFAEDYARAYNGKSWVDKERTRLTETIDKIAKEGRP
jgi:DNA-binding ferritin-like protein (Dps family)